MVSGALRDLGIPVLDADVLARDVIDNSKSCLGDLVLEFGCGIIDHNGELNRRAMSAIVFTDRQKLRRLNAITHPHIVRRIEEEVERYRKAETPILVLDAPTLYEAGVDRICVQVIAVIAPQEMRLRRILERDGITEEEAMNRIRSQHDDAFFRQRADFVVVNDGTADAAITQVKTFLGLLPAVPVETP